MGKVGEGRVWTRRIGDGVGMERVGEVMGRMGTAWDGQVGMAMYRGYVGTGGIGL